MLRIGNVRGRKSLTAVSRSSYRACPNAVKAQRGLVACSESQYQCRHDVGLDPGHLLLGEAVIRREADIARSRVEGQPRRVSPPAAHAHPPEWNHMLFTRRGYSRRFDDRLRSIVFAHPLDDEIQRTQYAEGEQHECQHGKTVVRPRSETANANQEKQFPKDVYQKQRPRWAGGLSPLAIDHSFDPLKARPPPD
jgi:hypothetical protein